MTVKLRREYICDMCEKPFVSPNGIEIRYKRLGETIIGSKHICYKCWASNGVINLRGLIK